MKRKTRAPSASNSLPEGKKKKTTTSTSEDSSETSATATICVDFTSPTSVLDSLLSPNGLDGFFADNWEKNPLLVKRKNADFYGTLFSKKDLLSLVKKEELQFVEDVNISRFVEGKTEILNGEGRVNLKDIKPDGIAVRLSQPQRFQDEVWKLLEPLETYFGCPVGADAVIFQPGSQGLAPQFDEVEMLILQLEGKTKWKLFKPMQDLPQEPSPDLEFGDLGEPTHEIDLEPGDLLYFPRGTIYHTVPLEDKDHTTYLEVTTYHENSWGNMLSGAVTQALEKAMENSVEYRRGLPVNLFSFMGSRLPEPDNEEADSKNEDKSLNNETVASLEKKKEAFKTSVVNLLKGLADHLIPDKAVDGMIQDFYASRLPPFGNDGGKGKKVSISDESKIKLLYPDHVRVIIGDLSDGFAAVDDDSDENYIGTASSEEEAAEESEASEKEDKVSRKGEKKQKTKKKEKASKKKDGKAKETKTESGEESEEKEGEAADDEEEDDDDEERLNENEGFEDEEGCDEYILVFHSVNNERSAHMMGEKMPCSTLKFPFRFKDALRQIINQYDEYIPVSSLLLPEEERLSFVKSLWSQGLLAVE